MISDVLFEARIEIERYLKTMPDVYVDMHEDLRVLCTTMARLQALLDTPLPPLDVAGLLQKETPA